jgi:hypothetical protein
MMKVSKIINKTWKVAQLTHHLHPIPLIVKTKNSTSAQSAWNSPKTTKTMKRNTHLGPSISKIISTILSLNSPYQVMLYIKMLGSLRLSFS